MNRNINFYFTPLVVYTQSLLVYCTQTVYHWVTHKVKPKQSKTWKDGRKISIEFKITLKYHRCGIFL